MENELLELDRMQAVYKTAVEEWITAIRHEEALASVIHSVAEIDKWEEAHFKEDEARNRFCWSVQDVNMEFRSEKKNVVGRLERARVAARGQSHDYDGS
jgi:hypothetical protein